MLLKTRSCCRQRDGAHPPTHNHLPRRLPWGGHTKVSLRWTCVDVAQLGGGANEDRTTKGFGVAGHGIADIAPHQQCSISQIKIAEAGSTHSTHTLAGKLDHPSPHNDLQYGRQTSSLNPEGKANDTLTHTTRSQGGTGLRSSKLAIPALKTLSVP